MKIKSAFTLAELIIALTVVATILVIMLPVLRHNTPDEKKVMIKKTYATVEKAVDLMINNDKAYPYEDLGFAYIEPTDESGSENKFCYYLKNSLNSVKGLSCPSKGSTATNHRFARTPDGALWDISFSVPDGFSTTTSEHPDDPTITVETPSTGYYTTITIDVNGSRKPNCSFSADCSDPDTYSVLVRYDGKIKIPTTDTYTINVLSNPLKNK